MAAMKSEGAAIELVEVNKRYKEITVLHSFSLDIAPGEFMVLLGPSGCGKSTLLKLISGLEDATGGEIYIGGQLANYMAPKARNVAMVFQNYALYPHMTVAENIGFPLKMAGTPKDQIAKQVAEVARILGLEAHVAKHPDQLSGGQRQRVALGRALIRQPVAFLMDEPLSNLDALLRTQMREELLKLHRRVGRTTIYVTHDQVEAMTMADRIVVMDKGVVQQVGTPLQVYAHPANIFVATFVGSSQMNMFHGRVEGRAFVSPALRVSLEGAAGAIAGEVTLGIRPEDVQVVDRGAPGGIPGEVEYIEMVGADSFLRVSLGSDSSCLVRVRPTDRYTEGEQVFIGFPGAQLHIFGADGQRVN